MKSSPTCCFRLFWRAWTQTSNHDCSFEDCFQKRNFNVRVPRSRAYKVSRLALVRRLFLLTHSEKLSIFDRVLGKKMEKCFKSLFFLMFTFIFISRESFYLVFKFARTDKITPRVLLGKRINRNSRKPTDLKGWFYGSVLLSDLFLGLQRFAEVCMCCKITPPPQVP